MNAVRPPAVSCRGGVMTARVRATEGAAVVIPVRVPRARAQILGSRRGGEWSPARVL